MTLKTDEELIALTVSGNRQAAGILADRYRYTMFRVAYRALGNADDAHDVAQESLIYGIQRLAELRNASTFSSWIRNITLSRCIDYRRRRGTRRLGEPITILNDRTEEANYSDSLAIRRALSHLSESLRTCVHLFYVGGYSVTEIATLLNVPANTVRSRLMAAKQKLRGDLLPELHFKQPMPVKTNPLSPDQLSLIFKAFPNSKVQSVQEQIEPWMPFSSRVNLELPTGEIRIIDFRFDISPDRADLLKVLAANGIAGPQLITGPIRTTDGSRWMSLTEVPRGDNLLLWALGGTPHRIRLATERAFEAIHQLQEVTPILQAHPLGATLPRRTLLDEIDMLTHDDLWNEDPWLAEEGKSRKAWLKDPWFVEALAKIRLAVAKVDDPLVYTHYSFFFPLSYRVQTTEKSFDEPLGAPGDPYYQENPLSEFVQPFGYFGDPLLGLAMVWLQDCYPFVHTGFVEQYLWRAGVSQRDFAPRLGIKALQMVARDLSVETPCDSRSYWSALKGWVDQAISWL